MGYLPKILLHLKNEPPISTDFEVSLSPPPPSSTPLAINNVQSLMYDNAFKTKENKIKPHGQRDKIVPQHIHPKIQIIVDQGNTLFPNYCLDM